MNLRVDWPSRGHGYTEEEIQAVGQVMRASGQALTNGPIVHRFEEAFAEYIGVKRAFSTMSCAHALDISAMLAGIEPGDEIVIPAHTYCASALAFARRGAVIRWADLDPHSLTMAPDSLRRLCNDKTKAVVLVHLYGLLSPHVEWIAEFCEQQGVVLIEDCAQAVGSQLREKHCGTFGDIGCYSFHAQKNLTTLGEGGMLVVKHAKWADKVPGLRLNGHAQFTNQTEYWLPAMGNVDLDIEGMWPIKSTMNEVQAAVGELVLGRLDALTAQRRARGMAFREAMREFPELVFQSIHTPEAHSHHLLPARYDGKHGRDALIRMLSTEYSIKAIIQYYPLNRYDLFRKSGHGHADVPETDRFFDTMVSFPFSMEINDADFCYMIESVRSALCRLRR
ncbi:DegT/DnrJ/EryC1/StrS family aminotransferase [Mycolicibacterium moriokaense]|nr:DegT/DnrJ/EryC1/StrS family aminotransferase [Mycolicibacterium moriokaense]